MKSQVLHSKVYRPRQRESTLFRPRLSNQLNVALDNPSSLILISASAGSGKTTLLADWITQSHLPCAWVSLDEEDNNLSHLMRYLVASLTTVGLDISEDDFPKNTETFWHDFVHLLNEIHPPLLIVLDDYHRIQSPLVHQGIEFLIEHLPPEIHLILATRSDPPLPLSRWRVRGLLTEIRKEDIQFTAGETYDFLNKVSGLTIDWNSVNALHQRTEGWVAGLQLAAISIQRHSDPVAFIAGFTGSHRFVLDYLTEEVLSQQDTRIRNFLLQTSILDSFDSSLCAAITDEPDSHAILDHLYRANLFLIPLDDMGQTYRYHHLFADLLRIRVDQDALYDVADLHRRAADWYAEHGNILDVLHHYMLGEHHQELAELVEREAFTLFNQGNISAPVGLIQRLPSHVIQQRPWLNAYNGLFLTLSGKIEDGETALSMAEQMSDNPNLIGFVAATRVHVRYAQLKLGEAEAMAEIALKSISDDQPFIQCYAYYGLSKVLVGLDRPAEAMATIQQSLIISDNHPHLADIFPILSFCAQIALLQNNLQSADQYLKQAQQLTKQNHAEDSRIASFWQAVRAQWLQKTGQLDEAFKMAQQALHISLKHHNIFSAIQALLAQAQILETWGEYTTACEQLEKAKGLLPQQPMYCDMCAEICLQATRLALSTGDLVGAKKYLNHCETGESVLLEKQKQTLQAQISNHTPKNPTIPTHPILVEQLSRREYEVLQLIAQGLSNAEIAETLVVSLSTVKKHSSSILSKLGVSNRTQAVTCAHELELLS